MVIYGKEKRYDFVNTSPEMVFTMISLVSLDKFYCIDECSELSGH